MKYFVVSDIHSFYDEMKTALDNAGYDPKNPEHTLIVCGDIFDRGEQTTKVFNFLRRIPKKRRILIRGNHEYLLQDAINEIMGLESGENSFDVIGEHHYSNGTIKSICHLLKVKYEGYYWTNPYDILQEEKDNNIIHEIVQWTMSNDWVDYYELNDLIFVHCWIPVINKDGLPMYYVRNRQFDFDTEWRSREPAGVDWEDATWGCPYKFRDMGLVPENKTIVCGHWHTSDMHQIYEGQPDNYDIYFSKDLIGLDACTARSGFCNVLVIDEHGKMFDQYGKELKGE